MSKKPVQLTIEQIQYGKPKEYKPKWIEETCKRSKVEPRHFQNFGVFEHAGTIVHVCWELKGHADEYCKCPCGHRWRAILEPASQKRIQE